MPEKPLVLELMKRQGEAMEKRGHVIELANQAWDKIAEKCREAADDGKATAKCLLEFCGSHGGNSKWRKKVIEEVKTRLKKNDLQYLIEDGPNPGDTTFHVEWH